MDKLVELEAKFEVPHLTTMRVAEWAETIEPSPDVLHVVGVDTFYSGNGIVLRHRRASPENGSHGGAPALTYKCRRRPGDIRDRIEIDLFLDESVKEETVAAFVEVMGLKEHFTILKESQIYHYCLENCTIVMALYDVIHMGKIRRFLEIEIDKESGISDEKAAELLQGWIDNAQVALGVGDPLNQSLYEMYAPRDALYLPETF